MSSWVKLQGGGLDVAGDVVLEEVPWTRRNAIKEHIILASILFCQLSFARSLYRGNEGEWFHSI